MRHLRQYSGGLAIGMDNHPLWLQGFCLLTCTCHTEIDTNNDLRLPFIGGSHHGCADESLHQDHRFNTYEPLQCVSESPTYITRDPQSDQTVLGFEPALSPYSEYISAGAAKVRYHNPGRNIAQSACMRQRLWHVVRLKLLARIGMIAHTSVNCMTKPSLRSWNGCGRFCITILTVVYFIPKPFLAIPPLRLLTDDLLPQSQNV